jgi:hypothetical protein
MLRGVRGVVREEIREIKGLEVVEGRRDTRAKQYKAMRKCLIERRVSWMMYFGT